MLIRFTNKRKKNLHLKSKPEEFDWKSFDLCTISIQKLFFIFRFLSSSEIHQIKKSLQKPNANQNNSETGCSKTINDLEM